MRTRTRGTNYRARGAAWTRRKRRYEVISAERGNIIGGYEAIVIKLSDFLLVDPLDLLSRSRDRGLPDEDFELLGSSPAAGAMWIEATEMETAISAAEHS